MDRIKSTDIPWVNTGSKQSLDPTKNVLPNQFLNGPSVAATGGATGVDSATPSLNPAESQNMVIEELRGLVVAAGLVPSATNWSQVLLAIQALISNATTTSVLDLIDGNLDAPDVFVISQSPPLIPAPSAIVDGGTI